MKKPFIKKCRSLTAMHILVLLAGCMLFSATANASGSVFTRDSILVSKMLTSKKYKIKIYPGASHEVLFFNASGEEGKVYQFFVFDLDGNLVKQAQIRNRQTTLLANFSKGCYSFEVFSDDEHIENGTLTIK